MRILACRLDNDGDVLLTGPAVRALAASGTVDLLASPAGRAAARLLPGVEDVLVFDPPWSGFSPAAVDPAAVGRLVAQVHDGGYDEAVVFTSFHQSPLPLALLLRMAGVPRTAAASEDYPGSLLDVRFRREEGPERHEVEAALALARAAGHDLPLGDDGRLRLRDLRRPAWTCPRGTSWCTRGPPSRPARPRRRRPPTSWRRCGAAAATSWSPVPPGSGT